MVERRADQVALPGLQEDRLAGTLPLGDPDELLDPGADPVTALGRRSRSIGGLDDAPVFGPAFGTVSVSTLRLSVVPFRPGELAQSRELEPTYEDVPKHLKHQLWTWTHTFLKSDSDPGVQRIRAVANHMRYAYASAPKASTYSTKDRDMEMFIQRQCEDPVEQLRIIEFLLPIANQTFSEQLKEHLQLGNSAYAVSSDLNRLEMRVTPEVKAQVEAVIASAGGSAGDHLANAWNEAYGRVHDAVKSYSESIKAVEAALAPKVTPQNAKQTLGTMIADVRNAPQKFKFAIQDGANSDGVELVLSMMRQLWDGQTSRHGGATPTRPETVEEAKAAVHLAAALVQWGVSGAFGRR